ncbi:uncharacterized protein FIBRA_02903 [Fibroporia radiculosa]|uniref:Uncharacterized protein n=1 Tax=Fibroporia radiculosa TaxID=599839 RepID=J4HVP2_9APHY|nr:uncharacterized protein FIBRA_02903 [Fibroporia radiculosa]CCM00857.1 predicted protein [Fibroporia radiculosa]
MKDTPPGEPPGPLALQAQEPTNVKQHQIDTVEIAQTSRPPLFTAFLHYLRGHQAIALPTSDADEDSGIETQSFRKLWQGKRRLILGCILLCIVLLAAILPPVIVSAVRSRRRRSQFTDPIPDHRHYDDCVHRFDWNIAEEASFGHHEFMGQTYMHAVNVSIPIPVSSVFSLESYGDRESTHGSLELLVDDGQRYPNSDQVHVEITKFTDSANYVQPTSQMCLMRAGFLNNIRLGLVTPHLQKPSGLASERTAFAIKVYFPPSQSGPLHFNHFEAEMPNFEYHADLGDHVFFKEMVLAASNRPINASITGRDIRVRTTNAPVYGSYNTTNNVYVMTQNAPIEVSASAIAPADDAGNARFELIFVTSNAKVMVAVPEAPPDDVPGRTILHTSNAPAWLSLPQTFTGSFTLSTTRRHAPQVHFDADAQTPGREREVQIVTANGNDVKGAVRRASLQTRRPHNMRPQSVEIRTSNSDVHLFLRYAVVIKSSLTSNAGALHRTLPS